MPEANGFYEAALTAIRELKETDPGSEPLLAYYEAVLHAQKETRAVFRPDLDGLNVEVCRNRISQGVSCLKLGDIRIDWRLFDALFDRISGIARERAETTPRMDRWPSLSGNSPEWRDKLLNGLMQDRILLDNCADRAGISRDMFSFLAFQTIPPFLESYAERIRDGVDDSMWSKGCCPVCSGEPLMGRLAKETGKRLLECHLCRTQWEVKRLECPFCGNDDQKKLRFFYDKEDRTHRVEVCDVCRTYLKSVDTRDMEKDVVLFVENLATIHLDLVARREGFQRETNRLFGL